MKYIVFQSQKIKSILLLIFVLQFKSIFCQPTIKELETLVSTPIKKISSEMLSGYVFESKDELTTYWNNPKYKGGIAVTEQFKDNLVQFSFFGQNIYETILKELKEITKECNRTEEDDDNMMVISSTCKSMNYRLEILKNENVIVMYSLTISPEVKIETVEFKPPITIKEKNDEIKKEENIVTFIDEEAQFKGGSYAMQEFIGKNLIYPKSALDKEIQGKVYVSFTIEIDGTISETKIVRGISECPECDAEVVRLIESMPKWIPGKVDGKPVRSKSQLPISFRI